MKKILLYYSKIFILALIVCLPVILPYFQKGFFPSHDGEWAVVRLGDMYREVKDFQFPARLSGYLNFEYGYPLFNFAYPAPYYFGLVFVFLKTGFVNSVKIMFALSAVLSFFSMFLLSESLWKNKWAGFISGILYIYVPYRIIDLFIRGSIGESLSFVLFPLILLGILSIYENKNLAISIFLTGVFYGLLITMHNIMAVLFSIIILFIAISALIKRKFNFLVNVGLSMIYALGLSAFFWIPAISEKNLILLSKIPIADRSIYFVKPLQLIIDRWGYGVPTDANGFGYQLGLPQILILFLVLVLALKTKNKDSRSALFLVLISFVISFLLFSQSSFIWSHLPFLSEINYPWTILSILALLISLMAGYLTKLGKSFIALSLAICFIAVILIVPHAKPQYGVNRGDDYYVTNQATTTSSNELMPLWVKKLPFQKAESKVELSSGKVENIFYNSRKISFSVNLPKPQGITINTIYYPGWKILIDGKETQINYDNIKGVMIINVGEGLHLITGKLTETPIRLISDIISLISLALLIIYLIINSRVFKLNK
jgi:hypothetical protein